jgi:hypothetical protein
MIRNLSYIMSKLISKKKKKRLSGRREAKEGRLEFDYFALTVVTSERDVSQIFSLFRFSRLFVYSSRHNLLHNVSSDHLEGSLAQRELDWLNGF